jgi:aminoglycoside 3-N-acetyltransferase I
MGYEIKKLGAGDLSLARQFIAQLHVEDGAIDPIAPKDGYLANLLSSDTFHVFVALDGDRVAGGLSAYELQMFPKEEKEMFLYDIEVIAPYRQKGVATQLIDALKVTCRSKGIRIIFVGTSTDSEPAIELYKTTGGTMELIPWFTYNL